MQGGNYQIDKDPILNLPLVKGDAVIQSTISRLVDEIIKSKKINQDVSSLEKEINMLVYRLYKLTPEEIEIIENEKA